MTITCENSWPSELLGGGRGGRSYQLPTNAFVSPWLMVTKQSSGYTSPISEHMYIFLSSFYLSIDDTSQAVYVPFLRFLALPLSPLLLSLRLLFTKPSFLQFNRDIIYWHSSNSTLRYAGRTYDEMTTKAQHGRCLCSLFSQIMAKSGELDKLGCAWNVNNLLHSSLLPRRKNRLRVLLHFRKL